MCNPSCNWTDHPAEPGLESTSVSPLPPSEAVGVLCILLCSQFCHRTAHQIALRSLLASYSALKQVGGGCSQLCMLDHLGMEQKGADNLDRGLSFLSLAGTIYDNHLVDAKTADY